MRRSEGAVKVLAQRIRGDSIAYGASMLLVRLLAFCTLAAFARLLTPEQLGAFNVLTMAGLALASVASMELGQALMRYCAGPGERARDAYYASAFWFVAATSAGCALAVIAFARPASRLLFADEQWSDATALYAVCIVANGVFLLLQSLCRSELRRGAFSAATITWAMASFLSSVAFALLSEVRLHAVILGQALGAFAGTVVALAHLGVPRPRAVEWRALRQLLQFSAPLVISVLSVLAATYANRFLLARWGSLEDVAAFTVAAQIANVATLALIGIQSALGPLVLAHHAAPETPRQVADLFGKFWVVTMGVCLLLGMAAEPLVSLLFPPGYRASAAWVFPLSFATILSQMYVFWPGFSIAKWTVGQMMVTVGSGLAGVAINVLAVMHWGVHGAVIGSVASSIVFLLSWVVLSNTCYRIPVAPVKTVVVGGAAVAAYLAGAVHGTVADLTITGALRAAAAAAGFVLVAVATTASSWRLPGQGFLGRGV